MPFFALSLWNSIFGVLTRHTWAVATLLGNAGLESNLLVTLGLLQGPDLEFVCANTFPEPTHSQSIASAT